MEVYAGLAKATLNQLSHDVDRSRFARITAYICGGLIGAAYVEIDYAVAMQAPHSALVALAIAGLLSIAVMLHMLGHVSRDRHEIIDAWFKAALFIIAGAAAATLLNALLVAASVVGLGVLTAVVTRANWLFRGGRNKFRTASAGAGLGLAEAAFLAAYLLQHVWPG